MGARGHKLPDKNGHVTSPQIFLLGVGTATHCGKQFGEMEDVSRTGGSLPSWAEWLSLSLSLEMQRAETWGSPRSSKAQPSLPTS